MSNFATFDNGVRTEAPPLLDRFRAELPVPMPAWFDRGHAWLAGPARAAARLTRQIKTMLCVCMVLFVIRLAFAAAYGVATPLDRLVPCILPAALTAALLVLRLPRAATITSVWAIFELGKVETAFFCVMGLHIGRGFPLADGGLAALDEALGWDWVAYLRFVDAHPWINDVVLQPAYLSIKAQGIAAGILLPLLGREREALNFVGAMTLGAMIVGCVGLFMPAYGTYHHYGVVPSMHPNLLHLSTGDGVAAALDWLRTESLAGAMPQSHGGLITFPSFHTTAAVLLLWAFRRDRITWMVALPLNLAMLAATPLQGSHYLADLLAGAAVAGIAIAAMNAATRSAPARSPVPVVLPAPAAA